MNFTSENHYRAGVRVLRPWLSSARLVRLFYQIGMLSGSRPGTISTIEMFVERMSQGRTATATLESCDQRRTG